MLAHFANNLRRLRSQRGLSQTALAEKSGLSRRMISAIEGGETNISLASVDRLAAALAVTFAEIVRPAHAVDNRSVKSLAWRGGVAGSEAMLLGAVPSTVETELWLWALGPGDSYRAETHANEYHEMIFVLEGRLTIDAEGDVFRLVGGEFKIFSSTEPYLFRNESAALVRFIRGVAL